MATPTFNSDTQLSAPPVPSYPAVTTEPEPEAAPPPNVFLAVLRRWPWLVLGIAGGLVLGFLYHTQKPAVYQSGAQLLVIRNRADTPSSMQGADRREAVVEDYVATQVTLLKSQKILELAARKLDDYRPYTVPPPEKERDRVAFLGSRFNVAREREPGSNTASNVLALTFRSPDPHDAPKYLEAIIAAYQSELSTLYEEASASRSAALLGEIKTLTNERSNYDRDRLQLEKKMAAISTEPLDSIRTRVGANLTNISRLELERNQVERDLKLIADTGPNRAARLVTMDRLRVTPDTPLAGAALDSRNPDDVKFALEQRLKGLLTKFGKDHPDVIQIKAEIANLDEIITARNGVAGGKRLDELERYALTLETSLKFLNDQLAKLTETNKQDVEKAIQMREYQVEIENRNQNITRLNDKINDRELERKQVDNTRLTGGFKAQAITKPGDGAQVAPVLLQSLLLGAVLGLMAGAGLGFLAELTDRSFRTPAEIRRRLGVPVLGHIPRIRIDLPAEKQSAGGLDPVLAAFFRPGSGDSEAYRGLRTQLYFSTQGRGHQVIQVTSPNPGDGKSTLAANLAISIAQSKKRVVLIDCDFRKPRVHKLFNLPRPEVGLASVMAGEADLDAAIQPCEIENLSLLPCGPRPANPAELLTSPKFTEVLTELRAEFEFVIIDTPPVLAVSDPSVVAPRVDGVLLVFRMTKNARPVAERAKEQLTAMGARVMGVVVNASTARSAGYGGYGYTYKYDYQYTYEYTDAPSSHELPALPKKG